MDCEPTQSCSSRSHIQQISENRIDDFDSAGHYRDISFFNTSALNKRAMLACTSWHPSPFLEAGSYNHSTSETFECDFGSQTTEASVESFHLSPSSFSSFEDMSQANSNNNIKSEDHSPMTQDLSAQVFGGHEQHDSGLGIITHGDIYSNGYDFSGVSHEITPSFYVSEADPRMHDHRKLSSPFEEKPYQPVPVWTNAYLQTTTTVAGSSLFATPAQQFQTPRMVYPSKQYSMSPASYTQSIPQYYTPQQIIRPTPQSVIKQEPSSAHSTPSHHWTPQTSSVVWQNRAYPTPVVPQPPTFMMGSSMCQDEDWCHPGCGSSHSSRNAMTVPVRRKPHLRPSLSESSVPQISSPARMRAATTNDYLQPPHYQNGPTSLQQQLPLPPMPPSVLVNTPLMASTNVLPSDTSRHTHRQSRSTSSTPNRRRRPVSPPASDFANTNVPYLIPVRQDPTFSGDLYTPKYKRRTPSGRWEGWCGYCQPGRWLDLKNSRYWEDKLRNHGICAKTKMKFAEPIEIKRVNADGSVVEKVESGSDPNDPFADQKKREGLCGTCGTWVAMDGLRTKARDRAVGWWMHAYKCHDHDKSPEETSKAQSNSSSEQT